MWGDAHVAKPKKPQRKALHKEFVFQTAEGSALCLFLTKNKKQQQQKIPTATTTTTTKKKPTLKGRRNTSLMMPERSP